MNQGPPPCPQCEGREGTDDRDGLIPREILDAIEEAGKTLSFFTCTVCGTKWTLIEEVATGRPPQFIRDILP